MKYVISNESITVYSDGRPHTVKSDSQDFGPLRNALIRQDWHTAVRYLSPASNIERWVGGKFKVNNDVVEYNGTALPVELNERIVAMARANDDPSALLNFWERLQRNPSKRSVEQLWPFLQHEGIPLTADGCFLAYKGVRTDFKDVHSGRNDNSVGQILKMPRNQISDDPNHACHAGLHVGAHGYATSFGPRVVIVKVDPEHVVCIPHDHSAQKMRVCQYEVVGNSDSKTVMPSTSISGDYLPPVKPRTFFLNEQQEELADEQVSEQRSKVRGGKGWKKFDEMDLDALEETNLDALRKYASRGLEIVGAYRHSKVDLIDLIIKVRG